MMWYWGGGVHWWGWLLGVVGMVVFWGLILWAVWYLVSGITRRPERPPQGAGDAKRILDERLARGEIGTEEYGRLLALIRGEGVASPDGRPTVKTGDER